MLQPGSVLDTAALRVLLDSDVPVGLAVLDQDLRYRHINRALAEANGVGINDHLGRSVAEVLPAAADTLVPLLREVLATGRARRNFRVEAEVPSLPGELSEWEASYLPIHEGSGPDSPVVGVLVQALNRSLERQTRQQQLRSEQQLRRVLDSLFVFVGVLSPEGILLESNRAPLEAGGLSLDQVKGLPLWETYWWSHDPEEQLWLRDAVRRAAAGETVRRDIVARMLGDSRMAVDFMLAPLRDERGRVTHLIPSGIDISARRASEQALQASEERFRRVFEGATVGMGLIDASGRILLANESMAQMFGYTRMALAGMAVHQLVPERQRGQHVEHVQHFMREPALRYMAKRQELYALRQDGSEFAVEIGLNPLPGSAGQQVLATISDVSARRAAQIQIERALTEKTVLLNEVHHRVKNNLQVISSLLSLQSRNAAPEVQAALRDSQSRVRSMALMHQLLFERRDFSALELGPFLYRLATLMRDTYLGGAASAIVLHVEAPEEGCRLDLQRAVPCGLLVTELVTNAIKHGFPGGRSGQILVRLWPDLGVVEVADDGVGLPEGLELGQGRSLGLQLLPLLAEQCRGRLELQRGLGGGTRMLLHLEGLAHV
ncbi:PAS domain-containing protein [Roseateles sp. DAIF2]|uniref:PAS domain-containing protein n=1 Tax=Roseateles sp. DAIF2 TaxID=2714952 RepID=UPI0018A2B0E0|nr:PAS domain-containing protein [Roseateles sp. DAIF2]QPF72050.1 PAS domain-containing protein [Roseateles sp. DAIF2]